MANYAGGMVDIADHNKVDLWFLIAQACSSKYLAYTR